MILYQNLSNDIFQSNFLFSFFKSTESAINFPAVLHFPISSLFFWIIMHLTHGMWNKKMIFSLPLYVPSFHSHICLSIWISVCWFQYLPELTRLNHLDLLGFHAFRTNDFSGHSNEVNGRRLYRMHYFHWKTLTEL